MPDDSQKQVIGLDFGTTNTIVTHRDRDGQNALLTYRYSDQDLTEFRSAMTFWRDEDATSSVLNIAAGPWAIGEFSNFPDDSRFLQSFKTFAASDSFQRTMIYGERFQFEDLLQAFYEKMLSYASLETDPAQTRLVVGRPVKFAGANPNENLAIKRYAAAFRNTGYAEVITVMEPVAAAFYYARKLRQDATVLVGDFGGGTSDFTIVRFEFLENKLTFRGVATSGVPVAGDALDFRIVDNVVSPALGRNSTYVSFGSELNMPSKYYGMLARWNDRFLLRSSKTIKDLNELRRMSRHPEMIETFIQLIENDSGINLYQSVSDVKRRLSTQDAATFTFNNAGLDLEVDVSRADFERWIHTDLERMRGGIQTVLDEADLTPSDIDKVFLTGGTSLVPAVKRLFSNDFGFRSIDTGDELISISAGLSLIGSEDNANEWTTDVL